MKPEALDAFATGTMRPSALEAATAQIPNGDSGSVKEDVAANEKVSDFSYTGG
jgi:hypothetical protein